MFREAIPAENSSSAGWGDEPHSIAEQRTITERGDRTGGQGLHPQAASARGLSITLSRYFYGRRSQDCLQDAAYGMQQAKHYAEMLGLKFAYATNGPDMTGQRREARPRG